MFPNYFSFFFLFFFFFLLVDESSAFVDLDLSAPTSEDNNNIASRLAHKAADHVRGFTNDLNLALSAVLTRTFIENPLLQPQVHLSSSNSENVIYCKSNSGSDTGESSGSGGGSASAGSGSASASSASASSTAGAVSSPWQLVEGHSGSTFFDGWTFTDAPDLTTDGIVNYVDQDTAATENLTEITSNGTVIMRVETTPVVTGNRDSIRITTNNSYNSGLWVLDAVHMPTGCGTWPAFWTNDNAETWPAGGEIDIVEGVGTYTNDQATIHTLEGCSLSSLNSDSLGVTGTVVTTTDCEGGTGCGIRSNSTVSYGATFNDNGGGVFTMTLNSTGIAVWFFERSAIPSDITAGTPLPGLWGTPFAWWSSPTCNITEFFGFQSTIFDTTLCGQLAGAVWADSGSPGQEESCATQTGVSDCETYVRANGAAFEEAYWEINSVKIYQIPTST